MPTVDEILGDIPKEGSDAFEGLEKETPSDSPSEKKPEEDKPVEGENTPEDKLPFHKHPRWIERENELKSLREREEENAKVIAELQASQEESKRVESSDIPDWFKELYGENEMAWQKYSQREQEREAELEAKIIQRQETIKQQEMAETVKWNKWVDEEITTLQAEGLKFDRNELIKTMLDYRPTDENNNFDFHKGYKIYEALKTKEDPAHSDARKKLADTATKTTSGEKPPKDYMTPADLRNRSWGNLI